MIKSYSISNAIFTNSKDGSISEVLNKLKFKEFSEMHQTHSDYFLKIDSAGTFNSDALVTSKKNLPLVVKTADCLPILATDGELVAAIHAGWRGLQNKIIEKSTNNFSKENLKVVVGPHAQSCCYEIKDDVAVYFENFIEFRNGRKYLSMKDFVKQYFGTNKIENEVSEICTICNPDYFSYRENGTKKRQFGLIWI
jgi:YfiH family protein